MNNSLWEKISSKYLFKFIFSYLNAPTTLKISKTSKKLRNILGISLFHYHYYYFFELFKILKIETFDDIINHPYLEIFPKETKYEFLCKFIESRKLFTDDYIFLRFEDIKGISFIQNLIKKQKKTFNYIIGDFSFINNDYNFHSYSSATYYLYEISEIIQMNKIDVDKILFDYCILRENKSDININYQDIKQININLDHCNSYREEYDITLFNNIEYLSISENRHYTAINLSNIKVKLSENQYNNIKTLTINNSFKEIFFKPVKSFANLNELYIVEKLLHIIKFNPKTLKKLNIIYDFRDKIYTIEYLQESINNLLEQYVSLTNLNISFFYKQNELFTFIDFIEEMSNFLFASIQNKENLTINFYDMNDKILWPGYKKNSAFCIKKINYKKSKYKIKIKDIPYSFFESHLYKIEEIDLLLNSKKNKCNLFIEENNEISAITKIRIKYGDDQTIYIPIKSFSSLNVL